MKPTRTSDVLIVGAMSSLVTFILTAILSFSIAFICVNGHVCTNLTKCAKLSNNEPEESATEDPASNTTYDSVPPTHNNVQQNLDLKENVAYASINY